VGLKLEEKPGMMAWFEPFIRWLTVGSQVYRAEKLAIFRDTLPSSVQGSAWYRWNRADPGRAMEPSRRNRVV
jgi:hypothetical protein